MVEGVLLFAGKANQNLPFLSNAAVGIASLVLAFKDPAAHNLLPLCGMLFVGAAGQISLGVWCLVDSSKARGKLVGNDSDGRELWDDHRYPFVFSLFVCALLEIVCSALFLWHRRLNQKKKQMWYGAETFVPALKGHHDDGGVSLQMNPTLVPPDRDETLEV